MTWIFLLDAPAHSTWPACGCFRYKFQRGAQWFFFFATDGHNDRLEMTEEQYGFLGSSPNGRTMDGTDGNVVPLHSAKRTNFRQSALLIRTQKAFYFLYLKLWASSAIYSTGQATASATHHFLLFETNDLENFISWRFRNANEVPACRSTLEGYVWVIFFECSSRPMW